MKRTSTKEQQLLAKRLQVQQLAKAGITKAEINRKTNWGSVVRGEKKKPKLSEKNIQDRLNFCELVESQGYLENSNRGKNLRSHVLWTGESIIELNPRINWNNSVVRTSDLSSVPVNQVPEHSLSIMMAGGICSRGKSRLVVIPGGFKVSASLYQEQILPSYIEAMANPELFPTKRKILFQQNMAPAHSARTSVQMVKDLGLATWEKGQWPAKSSDLNVIEHVWHVLQNSVLVQPRPSTMDELIQRVTETWNSITREDLTNLVESFPKRILECKNSMTRRANH